MSHAVTMRIHRLLACQDEKQLCNSNHNAKLVVPVSPYRIDVPNSNKLLAKPLISKYLMAASVARAKSTECRNRTDEIQNLKWRIVPIRTLIYTVKRSRLSAIDYPQNG